MQVAPSPWAGSCPEASCLRVTYAARTVSVCPSLVLCSPSPPVPSALPESDFARLRKWRSFMGVCRICSEGSAGEPAASVSADSLRASVSADSLRAQSRSLKLRRYLHGTSIPDAQPRLTRGCSSLLPRRFAPVCQMPQFPQGKP